MTDEKANTDQLVRNSPLHLCTASDMHTSLLVAVELKPLSNIQPELVMGWVGWRLDCVIFLTS